MCIALDKILKNEQTYDAREQFKNVFTQLLCAKELAARNDNTPCEHSKQLAENLDQLADCQQDCLQSLARHDTYSRHIIGIDDNWVGLICRWEKNVKSAIHGHPSFAYYQVLDGFIKMEFFEPINDTQARQMTTNTMRKGDSLFSSTPEGQFNNLIHRVRTEDSPVFTLHLYSDNPAKGQVFQAA